MARFNDICRLLDSVENQTYHGIEVVFVVDQSEQLMEAIQLYSQEKKFSNFSLKVLLNKDEQGVNVCRNMAILASEGDIVGIVDDDTLLFPNWVEKTIDDFLEDDDLAAMTGPALPLWEAPALMSWFPQELYFVWGCTVWDWGEKRDIRNVGGMNCSFRRSILVKAGLYKPGIGPQGGEEKIRWFYPSGEEVELSLRIRKLFPDKRIIYDPFVKVYHKAQRNRFSMSFIIKRIFRFGYSKNYVRHLFSSDNSGNVLDLEQDYIKIMILSIPKQFFKQLFRTPNLAFRRLMMVIVGCLFVGFGFIAYEILPYHSNNN